jgi:hypothetical protein
MLPWIVLLGIVALFVWLTVLIETERWGWATISLVATCGITGILQGRGILDWFTSHWQEAALYTAGYLVVGVIWSFAKWFSYLMNFRDRLREKKAAFLTSRGIKGFDASAFIPEDLLKDFQDYLGSRYDDSRTLRVKPQASDNKARIVAWMSFWPFSFIGTVLNDPIRRLFNFLFNQFKALYQRMSDHVFRNDKELQ